MTRSISPKCHKVIDAKVLLRDNKVCMRKRCPDCGPFEALFYADAQVYTSHGHYNKPGTIPVAFSGELRDACPYDCGLCPGHQNAPWDSYLFTFRHLTLELTPDCILSMGVKRVSYGAKIGQVAQETGLTIDTIRFYEKQGLLRRSPRTAGGFRMFGATEIETLRFVRKAQELGFSLNEIRELLVLRADHVPACSHVNEILDQKLAAIEQKIKELQNLERSA
jgi:DNA-binding transcriptional MerR regulator